MIVRQFISWIRTAPAGERAEATRSLARAYLFSEMSGDDRAAAEVVLSALLAGAGSGEIFLDVPGINRDAVALAQDLGLVPVFETARMYTGAIPPLRLERMFGVTSFELG